MSERPRCRFGTLSLNINVRFVPAEPSQNVMVPDLRVLAGTVDKLQMVQKIRELEGSVVVLLSEDHAQPHMPLSKVLKGKEPWHRCGSVPGLGDSLRQLCSSAGGPNLKA